MTAEAARKRDDEFPQARRARLVLIADDTPDTRELYGLYLHHVGFNVELAADGSWL